MCFRQKTESSLLDVCHNTLQLCPEVVRIVLPCKIFSLMCILYSKQSTPRITHFIQVTCIELWTTPLLLRIVSLSTTTTEGQMEKKKELSSYKRGLDTFIIHTK